MTERPGARSPISRAHARLGAALRETRVAAAKTTREIPKGHSGKTYSSGHISLIEAGAVAPSPELVDEYVALGGDRAELGSLYQQMLAATDEAARRRRGSGLVALSPPTPPASIDDVRDRREVQHHYIVPSHEAHYVFADLGQIQHVTCTVRIRARTAGVRLYYCGFAYPSDQRPGVLSIQPLSGVTTAGVRESPTGALACFFLLDEAIAPNDAQPYVVSYRVDVHSQVRAIPRLRYFADEGNERLRLLVDFSARAAPENAWWFAARDVVDVENGPPTDLLASTGSYERQFERLIPGWCYGFGWSW